MQTLMFLKQNFLHLCIILIVSRKLKQLKSTLVTCIFPLYLHMICWFESLGVASWRFPNGWTWLKQPKGKNLPRTILIGITSGQVMELFAFLLLWKNIKHLTLSVKTKSSYRTRNIFCKLKRCSPKLCRASSVKKICTWYFVNENLSWTHLRPYSKQNFQKIISCYLTTEYSSLNWLLL